jgi:transcriptional regulator with GAF, ATPase, and Fis domain
MPGTTAQETLSHERKVRMHEAREAIINRLAPDIHSEIDLDKFLHAIVAELGRMMNVDRCDVIQLARSGELRISHEWRAAADVPSSLGTSFPVDIRQLGERFNLAQPIRLDDTSAPNLDPRIGLLPKSLGTRSLLVVPVVLDGRVLGLVGLHMTRATLGAGRTKRSPSSKPSRGRSRSATSTRGSTRTSSARPTARAPSLRLRTSSTRALTSAS